MTEIPPVSAQPSSAWAPDNQDLQQVRKKFKQSIDEFNALLPPRDDQIHDFAKTIKELHSFSVTASDMTKNPVNKVMEDLQDSAITIQTILSQPLSIPDANDENVSLLSAALSFKEQDEQSDLYKICNAFSQYAEQTDALKTELLLTSHDLD